jgi:hypothetical protein
MPEIIIRRDESEELAVNVGDVGWLISEGLQAALIKELESLLGGEFSDQFDPVINEALDMLSGGVLPYESVLPPG